MLAGEDDGVANAVARCSRSRQWCEVAPEKIGFVVVAARLSGDWIASPQLRFHYSYREAMAQTYTTRGGTNRKQHHLHTF